MGWVTSICALFQMKIQNINLIQKSKMSRAHPAKVGEILLGTAGRHPALILRIRGPALSPRRRIALPGTRRRTPPARILPAVNSFFFRETRQTI